MAGKPGITVTTNIPLDWRPGAISKRRVATAAVASIRGRPPSGGCLTVLEFQKNRSNRISSGQLFFDYVTGLTVDGAGALWVVRQTPAQDDAAIWRSVDRGTSWEAVSRVPLIVADIDAVGDALFLTALTQIARGPTLIGNNSIDPWTED